MKTLQITNAEGVRTVEFFTEEDARAVLEIIGTEWIVQHGFENIERDGSAVGSINPALTLMAELI